MSKQISPCVCTIANDQLKNVEELALETINMSKDRATGRFSEAYETTRSRCYETFECQGMYAEFPIVDKEGDEIRLEGGAVLKSRVLADALRRADAVILYAAVAHGYEAVTADPDNSMIEGMFYDGWGSGFSMAAHRWLKRAIANAVHESGRFVSRAWIPGEDGVEMRLQEPLFEQLDPAQIGLSMASQFSMRPIMSVTGIMGVSDDQDIEGDGI